jgi:hypothetical protein
MTPGFQEALVELKPRKLHSVMDLVQEAGIDVAPWAVKRDGTPVKEPRANSHYCYEWAFGNEAEGFVLCVWHASLKEIRWLGKVTCPGAYRNRGVVADSRLNKPTNADSFCHGRVSLMLMITSTTLDSKNAIAAFGKQPLNGAHRIVRTLLRRSHRPGHIRSSLHGFSITGVAGAGDARDV